MIRQNLFAVTIGFRLLMRPVVKNVVSHWYTSTCAEVLEKVIEVLGKVFIFIYSQKMEYVFSNMKMDEIRIFFESKEVWTPRSLVCLHRRVLSPFQIRSCATMIYAQVSLLKPTSIMKHHFSRFFVSMLKIRCLHVIGFSLRVEVAQVSSSDNIFLQNVLYRRIFQPIRITTLRIINWLFLRTERCHSDFSRSLPWQIIQI